MSEIDRAMLQSMAASFRGALEFSFNRHDMAKLMDRCATRTDLSQAAVAAALEAAKDDLNKMPRREERLGGQRTQYIQLHEAVETIAALITHAQHDALAAHVAAEVAKARAEDAAVLSKLIEATETARDYVSDASMGYVWHQDQSGSPLVKLDTKMPKDDIKAIDAALAAARDVEAALAQIGAKP